MQQAMTLLRSNLATGERAIPFKRSRIGWILVVLNTLMALTSANFFLGMLKTDLVGWLMMNTCAPSIALFVLGFLLGSPVVMVASAALMFRYGTLGLFVFSWSGGNLIAQVGHILMTLAVVYVMTDAVRNQRWKVMGLGLALGVVILSLLVTVQDFWIMAHPAVAEKLFSGNLMPPGQ
jgi:hypothetical protein